MTKIVCLSDTHRRHGGLKIPEGDILIHAGDVSDQGSRHEIYDFLRWFSQLPHRHKVFIAGNHDWLFERNPVLASGLIPPGVTYLQDSGCEFDGLKIWGSPVTPTFFDWAFNRERGATIEGHWQRIPLGTDVVVSHGPALGILDQTLQRKAQGCADLLKRLEEVRPRLHVCGHIHAGYGKAKLGETLMVNASICNEVYYPINAPVVVEL